MARTRTKPAPSWRRTVAGATALTGAGVLVNGLRLRARAEGLSHLGSGPVAVPDLDRWTSVRAEGVVLHPDTLAAAAAWAVAEGLDALDVVPADLPVARALDLLRQVEPATFRSDPLVEGRTAGHAIVVRTELAERADLPVGPVSPAELIEVARQVKRYAPRTTDLAVAATERAVDHGADEQLATQRTIFDRYSTVNLTASAAELTVLGTGVAASPALGAAALAALHAQPALVFSGNPAALAPRDLASNSLGRWIHEVKRIAGLIRAHAPEATSILLLFPAEVVRSFPRSRWTLSVSFEAAPSAPAGEYVLDHTPWQELAGSGDPAQG